MTPIEQAGWLGLAVLGVGCSMLYSGLEMGTYSLSRARLDLLAASSPPNRRAQALHRQLERPDRLLSTLLIGNNLANYAGLYALTVVLEAAGYRDGAIIAFNVLVISPLLLIFAESLPKEAFRLHADRFALRFTGFLEVSRVLFLSVGLLPVMTHIGRLIAHLVGAPSHSLAGDARQRVSVLLKEGAGYGLLSESQTSLVDRALRFRAATVADEMVPWAGVQTVYVDWPRDRLERMLASALFTRFPVVDRRGRVVGVLRHMDAFLRPEASVSDLMARPVALDAQMPVREALSELRRQGARIAVVTRGERPVGIVTTKDLVEPLVGEIAEW